MLNSAWDWRQELAVKMMALMHEWDTQVAAENAVLVKENTDLHNQLAVLRNFNLYVGACVEASELPMDFGDWVKVRMNLASSVGSSED